MPRPAAVTICVVDWHAWHDPYDDPATDLARRLAIVQAHVADWLTAQDERPLKILSACAGQGRDVLTVLAENPAPASRVSALLVENDRRNVELARAQAEPLNAAIEVRDCDAGDRDSYAGGWPADLLLFCGVFGNITDADIERTIGVLPSLCAPDATVLWTRGRCAGVGPRRDRSRMPDTIRGWFAAAGFQERAFDAPDDTQLTVGRHQLARAPTAPPADPRLFEFVRGNSPRRDR